jgi:hypothetical protein
LPLGISMTLLLRVVAQALSRSAAKTILFFIPFIFFPFSDYTAVAVSRRFLEPVLNPLPVDCARRLAFFDGSRFEHPHYRE